VHHAGACCRRGARKDAGARGVHRVGESLLLLGRIDGCVGSAIDEEVALGDRECHGVGVEDVELVTIRQDQIGRAGGA